MGMDDFSIKMRIDEFSIKKVMDEFFNKKFQKISTNLIKNQYNKSYFSLKSS
jgi:hypothetical protein